ncbi:MAG: hypothetical protein EBT58_08255, partial [Betaproteobacteria bacterium]|nr:hypothetical protein [Betaproteobacteria bacterium]
TSIVFSNVATQTIAISGITLGGADGGNYVVNVAGSQASYSAAKITPKSVTIIGATGVTKTYDGTTQLPVGVSGTGSISGVVGSDVVTTTGRGVFNNVNASVSTGDRGIVRGNLELDGADSANYQISGFTTGSGTISKAVLTVKANDAAGVVGIASFETLTQQPSGSYEGYEGVTYIGLMPADISSGSTPNAGVITKGTVRRTGYAANQTDYLQAEYLNELVPSGYSAGNYTIQYATGNYLIARSAQLSVRVQASEVYGSSSINYTILGGNYCVGSVCSQGLSSSSFTLANGVYTFTNSRPDTTASGSGFTLSGATLTAASSGAFNTQASVGARVRIYSGAGGTGTLLTDTLVSTVTNADNLVLATNPGSIGSIGSIVFNHIDKATFTLDIGALARGTSSTINNGTGLSITGGELTAQAAANSIARFYAGEYGSGALLGTSKIASVTSNTNAVLASTQSLGGPIGSVVLESARSTTNNYTVGTHSLFAPASSLQNIERVVVAGNLSVTPKSLTVTASGATKVYDGLLTSAAQVSASGIVSAVVNSVSVTDAVVVSGVTSFSSRNVGAGNVPYTISNIGVTGADAGNYTVQGGGSLSFSNGTIDPRPVTITVGAGPTRVYSGVASFAATAAERGAITLAGGDTLNSFLIGYSDKNAGTGKAVTFSSAVISDGNGGNNYSITYASGVTGTITQRPSVTWIGGSTGNWFDSTK